LFLKKIVLFISGGIHPEATCKELCDVFYRDNLILSPPNHCTTLTLTGYSRWSLQNEIKYFPEKNISIFATFIDVLIQLQTLQSIE
jgi:hypothetical protein